MAGPCCDHNHLLPDLNDDHLLDRGERRRLALRLVLAVLCAGLLAIALVIHLADPARAEIANLIAGGAAALVGIPVMAEAWRALRRPSLHGVSDLLVAAACVAAWAVGDLESAALVPLAMVIGHVLEERSLLGSREAIAALARLTKVQARRIAADGAVSEVQAESLAAGERVEVRPGDRIPADGVVREGASSVDTAPITGESVPVEVAPGSAVDAGTINLAARLVVEVTATGAATTLGRVVALMHDAEAAKPPVTRLLERWAGAYLALVLLVAACALLLTGSVMSMMAVLVAACPCALVIAAPATAIASLAVAGRHGILVKGTAFLEEMADCDAVVLDKTGTVTVGHLELVAAQPHFGVAESELRAIAAGLGAASSHPVSRAIAAAVEAGARAAVAEVAETGGMGVQGRLDGRPVAMGRAAFLASHGASVGEPPAHDGPVVGVVRDGAFLGWLLLADEPRAEAAAALADLRQLGLVRQVMITGDRRSVAESTAARLGITEIEAEALLARELERVQAEIAAGRRPLVVGDGVNDALALKAGSVGVAMGAKGADVALASADVVLMTSDLRRLGTCIRLSRRCRRTINLNVALGLGWTLAVVAAAALGLIGPIGAILIHNLGTLAVMANAGRLLRFDETVDG
jgi:heavy metal translocating P-type ATPase